MQSAVPAWAKKLAGPLPKATAQMLVLDAAHRTGNRLDPALRARMRWAVADANRCAYAMAAAEGDLRRTGASSPAADGPAIVFARKLATDAATLTDDEVRQLVEQHGEAAAVAIVALVAQACFQDRLILALNPTIEPNGPPPPVTIPSPHTRTPVGPPPALTATGSNAPSGSNLGPVDEPWRAKSFDDLQASLEQQRTRRERIRIPNWSEVDARCAPDAWVRRWPRVLWGLVCYAHQPELTDQWFDTVDAFRQESGMDRVLQQDLFWIVTRALDCFY